VPITNRLRETVIERDARAIWQASEERMHHDQSFRKFLASRQSICLVELFEKTLVGEGHRPLSQHCSGRTTLDHVKDQPMMGKKAPDDEYHLVALCYHHNSYHPPSRKLRAFQRAYLADCRASALQQAGSSDQPEVAASQD